jgi:hypothetical protein
MSPILACIFVYKHLFITFNLMYICLSPQRPGFAPGLVHVGFAVDKVALGQVFLQVLRKTGGKMDGQAEWLSHKCHFPF